MDWLTEKKATVAEEDESIGSDRPKNQYMEFRGHKVRIVSNDNPGKPQINLFVDSREVSSGNVDAMIKYLTDLDEVDTLDILYGIDYFQSIKETILKEINSTFDWYIEALDNENDYGETKELPIHKAWKKMYEDMKKQCNTVVEDRMNQHKTVSIEKRDEWVSNGEKSTGIRKRDDENPPGPWKRPGISRLKTWFHINSFLSDLLPAVDQILAQTEQSTGHQ